MDQWNGMESPEADLQRYSLQIFDKGAKAIKWSHDCLFNKCYWNNWASTHTHKMNLDTLQSSQK